jgi:hypothetical protein
MEKNRQQILEELIQRELSKLPERPAPRTLIPGVLAQIRARERKSWWQNPWTQWPLSLQLASLPFLLAGLAGAVMGVSVLWDSLLGKSSFDPVSNALGSLSAAWNVLTVLGNAVVVLGRAAGQEWLLLALFIPLSMYLACVGLGTLCYRTAFYRR